MKTLEDILDRGDNLSERLKRLRDEVDFLYDYSRDIAIDAEGKTLMVVDCINPEGYTALLQAKEKLVYLAMRHAIGP